ncbi:Transposon TX1 uncharacterized 149 kDa protein [Stylophora pistillata]|uniref:Transposon TX1 uncharacterized 149 kDa protein n=1 Tax=Stylophora pistillata TaxID=50429 RepID=A0A2B4RCF8_STYPI|nr:Transposon TX1 uncharacterized 149 kDa protein [Stylophora pistillata]
MAEGLNVISVTDNLVDRRTRSPTILGDDGKISGPGRSARRRRLRTLNAAKMLHGATAENMTPAYAGLMAVLNESAPLSVLSDAMIKCAKFTKKVIPKIMPNHCPYKLGVRYGYLVAIILKLPEVINGTQLTNDLISIRTPWENCFTVLNSYHVFNVELARIAVAYLNHSVYYTQTDETHIGRNSVHPTEFYHCNSGRCSSDPLWARILTVDIKCEHFPAGSLPHGVFGLIDAFFAEDSPHKVLSIQAVPNRVARVTCDNVEGKSYYVQLGVVIINGSGHLSRSFPLVWGRFTAGAGPNHDREQAAPELVSDSDANENASHVPTNVSTVVEAAAESPVASVDVSHVSSDGVTVVDEGDAPSRILDTDGLLIDKVTPAPSVSVLPDLFDESINESVEGPNSGVTSNYNGNLVNETNISSNNSITNNSSANNSSANNSSANNSSTNNSIDNSENNDTIYLGEDLTSITSTSLNNLKSIVNETFHPHWADVSELEEAEMLQTPAPLKRSVSDVSSDGTSDAPRLSGSRSPRKRSSKKTPGHHSIPKMLAAAASFSCCMSNSPNCNPARDLFFEDLHLKIDPLIPTLLAGDFNCVFNRSLDRRSSNPSDYSRESSSALSHLFDACCVTDIWRYLHPSSPGFTWTRWDGSLASRIDMLGILSAWVPSVSSVSVYVCPFSDHRGLCLSVSVPDVVPPGPGYWKLNTSILEDQDYCQLVREEWSAWRLAVPRFPSLAKLWDRGKSRIKGLTIRFCASRARKTSACRDALVRLVQHLQEKVDSGVTSCVDPLRSALSELARLDSHAAKGAHVRARVKWVEEGESSSQYFFRLEKKRSANRRISALREPDGSIVSSSAALCASLGSYYSGLYTASPTDSRVQSSLLGNLSSFLPQDQPNSCKGPLTPSEVLDALKGMARNKTPGLDGLPMEFYLRFWDVVGADLVAVLNECSSSSSLSLPQRRGVITLSFKKGDRLDPKNWRPISLLNVDYKLASRAIAGRLLRVIHLVVNRDQTCGVPGRFIGENVALLRDVVSYAESSGTPVAILSLDQEKAFDRVDWGFMRSTLLAMGFGSSFVAWIDLFYTRVQSAVNVNGYLTPFFSLSRGVRQGCPLSSLLYVLVSEVLACSIRADPRIKGLSLPGCPPLSPISQYADDTSLILTSDEGISAALDIYRCYELASGSRINLSKSKGLWLDGWRGRTDPTVPFDWSPVKLKVLGVFIGPGNLEEDNWRPRINAVDYVLKSWRSRVLSFRGKALVINALALSRVCFDFRVLPPFYQALVLAWRKLDEAFATSKNSLVYGSPCPLVCSPVLTMSAKSCYLSDDSDSNSSSRNVSEAGESENERDFGVVGGLVEPYRFEPEASEGYEEPDEEDEDGLTPAILESRFRVVFKRQEPGIPPGFYSMKLASGYLYRKKEN